MPTDPAALQARAAGLLCGDYLKNTGFDCLASLKNAGPDWMESPAPRATSFDCMEDSSSRVISLPAGLGPGESTALVSERQIIPYMERRRNLERS